MTERLFEALKNADAAAERGVPGASDDARKLAATIQSMAGERGPKHPLMGQLNAGIADVVDFINPFDKPHALNPFPEGTGSMGDAMRSVGIEAATGEPETLLENFMRGSGQAAGSLIPTTMTANALSKAGGTVGHLADDVYRSLAARGGATGEVVAGGVSRAAEDLAEDAGAPEWVQNTAAIAAPMSIPAAAATAKQVSKYTPLGLVARKAKAALAPYTKDGAAVVAGDRMVSLAGGQQRADELVKQIDADNPLNLTPAQQTGDPNMLAVERLASDQDPNIRVALDARRANSADLAKGEIDAMSGNVADAQGFFQRNRAAFKADLQKRANQAIESAQAQVQKQAGKRTEAENSRIVADAILSNLDSALAQERAIWADVPREAMVSTSSAKKAAQDLVDATPYAQRNDIPRAVRDLLDTPDVYGDQASVSELYGAYSELRRTVRVAMAGSEQNKNKARIANEVAEAILQDLGATPTSSEVGQKINEARAFSAALHETFDQGATGRILRRSLEGDSVVEPEMTLKRTVERGGVEGMVASRQLEQAGGQKANDAITDYLTTRFVENATKTGTDKVALSGARTWFAKNQELLKRYPDLKEEMAAAIKAQESAEQLAARVAQHIGGIENARLSAVEKFSNGQAERAVNAITTAKNPVQAARKIAAETRRDKSGKALDGVKAAFSDYLIAEAGRAAGGKGLDAASLTRTLSDPNFEKAMRVVFSPAEMGRIKRISTELQKAQTSTAANIGSDLSGAKFNRALEWVARVAAARHGAKLGGGDGGSLQTANMASERVKSLLNSLAADKASQMMADAVTDPELFKALLQGGNPRVIEQKAIPYFLPYLIGAVASSD